MMTVAVKFNQVATSTRLLTIYNTPPYRWRHPPSSIQGRLSPSHAPFRDTQTVNPWRSESTENDATEFWWHRGIPRISLQNQQRTVSWSIKVMAHNVYIYSAGQSNISATQCHEINGTDRESNYLYIVAGNETRRYSSAANEQGSI